MTFYAGTKGKIDIISFSSKRDRDNYIKIHKNNIKILDYKEKEERLQKQIKV
ncbi:MAG: hypothetical protein FWC68_03435 [Oscillospiraceae bacterium]|nr:hypothetical protein [Oscillospiraceae bacterium]